LDASYDYDLVCIGSGPAGQRAAVQASKLGKRAAVVEKKRIVGGVSVDSGTIPSKTFREAVIYFAALHSRFDRRKLDAPPAQVSAEALLARVIDVVMRESDVVENQLDRNRVEMLHGAASFIDPHTLRIEAEEGVRTVRARYILVAVGTRPFEPPGVPFDGRVVITSDGVVDIRQLPRSMTVIGGGVIGIEYAPMFAALGIDVTLVDRAARPLQMLDTGIVDELLRQLHEAGIHLRLEDAVEQIEIRPEPRPHAHLRLKRGDEFDSDLVLYSVGRVGNTDRLNLRAAGLTADERGRLEVGPDFRTQVPHILAAGDVIGYPMLAATSSEQGRLAACQMFGVDSCSMAQHYPIGIYSIPEISTVGASEEELRAKGVDYVVGMARYREIARGQILGDDSGLFKMLFDRKTRRLLGVHIIGTGATELIHTGQAVIGLGGGLDYFLTTVFNYPTLAECYKVASLDASNKLSARRPL
jgi:NAD(P) transhydrogenase